MYTAIDVITIQEMPSKRSEVYHSVSYLLFGSTGLFTQSHSCTTLAHQPVIITRQ